MGNDQLADIGELNILEAHEDDQGTGDDGGSLAPFDVKVDADFAGRSAQDEFALDVLESSGAEVSEDGTIVSDVLTVLVDDESGFTVIDEVIGVSSPDGTQITEERISVVDPEGNYSVISDDVDVE